MNYPEGVTISEALRILGWKSRSRIYRYLGEGKLDGITVMGTVFIPKSQVERLKK